MSEGDDLDKANLRATYGALFFGVPSQGMDISSLVPMVGDQPNRYFLESLGKESEILQEQRLRFPKAFDFRDSEIISLFETQESPTAERVSWSTSPYTNPDTKIHIQRGEKWSMTGKPTVLVDSASATHSRPWELEDRYVQAINRSHSDLVKFTKQDEDYEVVLHHLRRFSSVAVNVVRDRFKVGNASSAYFYPEVMGDDN
jgi:protein SERAC1